jgi:hypothetical protein
VLLGIALFVYLQYGRGSEEEPEEPEPIYYFDELEMDWPPN